MARLQLLFLNHGLDFLKHFELQFFHGLRLLILSKNDLSVFVAEEPARFPQVTLLYL